MFVDAIETADQYTRPIHIISRLYNEANIIAGAGTLFFVNDQGCAVTCRHVVEVIIQAEQINQNYRNFSGERQLITNNSQVNLLNQRLEQKYNIQTGTVITQKIQFVSCFEEMGEIDITLHPHHDLAILRFKNYKNKQYGQPALFLSENEVVKQGKSLCRLGYPFPEFTNFRYVPENDDIDWTLEGRTKTPSFPIDGIVTRHIGDERGQISGIEMSTPGLRGQSGGPLFDTRGVVYGMQSMTRHLHLGFDMVNQEVWLDSHRAKVSNHPYLHVGMCVHGNVIKEFLRQNDMKYYEATSV